MSIEVDFFFGGTGKTLFYYLKRDADGLYWDTSDSTFKSFASISPITNGQISLPEDSDIPGRYTDFLTLTPGSQFPDGIYTSFIYEGSSLLVAFRHTVFNVDEVRHRINLYDDFPAFAQIFEVAYAEGRTGLTLTYRIQRESDKLYFDFSDSTFKAFGSLVTGTASLPEDSNISGFYNANLSLSGLSAQFTDGSYKSIIQEGTTLRAGLRHWIYENEGDTNPSERTYLINGL